MSELLSKCAICGGLIDEEDLFCGNCGTEAPLRPEAQARESRVATHTFRCQGCGASMSYDASAGTIRCPFCGGDGLEALPDTTTLKPSKVVPFATTDEEAEIAMRRYLGRGFWRPGDLAQQARVEKMTRLYVPYWLFRAKTITFWTADTDAVPASASGDWRPVSGSHHGSYEHVLIGASGALSPLETSNLRPFDLEPGLPPEDVDLDNVTVEQFTVARKYARPLARQALEELEARACAQKYVPGQCRNIRVSTRIQDMWSEPILLPVFIMAYRYRDQVFRFLVNGQSGKASGDVPISWRKALAAGAIALGLVILLLVLMGVFR